MPKISTSEEIFKAIASKSDFDLIGERRHLVNYHRLLPSNENNEDIENYDSYSNEDRESNDNKIHTMLALNNTSNESNTIPPGMDPLLMEQYLHNRAIESPWYHLLIAMYSVLIVFGAIGNIMVVIAVVRKPIMRTARNLFILNLAISGEWVLGAWRIISLDSTFMAFVLMLPICRPAVVPSYHAVNPNGNSFQVLALWLVRHPVQNDCHAAGPQHIRVDHLHNSHCLRQISG